MFVVCFDLVWFSFYTNLLHVSETVFKGVYSIWLFVAEKENFNYPTQGILCSSSSKGPSLSPLPPSVEFILYKVSRVFSFLIFFIANVAFAD